MSRIYWCEFPKEVDWNKLASWIDDDDTVVVYVASSSRKEYDAWVARIAKVSKRIEVNVWPTLPKEEGYWFSSFTSREMIDSLDQYKGLKMKIDIEPPIPVKYSLFTGILWLGFSLFKFSKNRRYLQDKVLELSKSSEVILSTFPLPKFMLNRWGWVYDEKLEYNFMHYSSFIPRILLWKYNLYHSFIVPSSSYVAVGLIGRGIFGNEPVYKSIKEMERDIKYLKKKGFEKFVFFRIGAIVERGKVWFDRSKV